MNRVSDYIIKFLEDRGIEDVFMISGGGAMFLNDAVALNDNVNALFCHHEQACAMAAVGSAKYLNDISAAVVTTGCGTTNALTGLLDAWQDSVPCLFISGQVKRRETTRNSGLALRQFGVQELDVIPIVESLTKYAVMVNEPSEIAYHMEKAYSIATDGRPGPVWIDVPMDVQSAIISEDELVHYHVEKKMSSIRKSDITFISDLLEKAERPIVLAGNGVRLADSVEELRLFVKNASIPCVVSYLGVDFFEQDNWNYIGRLGIKGDRAGNFAIQNSDLVICIGCRLSVALTGFEYDKFAREAKLIVVDVDSEEHKKKTVKIDYLFESDAKLFLKNINSIKIKKNWNRWLEKCNEWKETWLTIQPEYNEKKVNKYKFIEALSEQLPDDSVVVTDAGSSGYVTYQSLRIKSTKQRLITSGAQMDMGFTIPASIGVSVASNNKTVVGITGDGSFQLNIQELQTIVHNQIPVKIFVWNNNGYLSIRTTQRKFFNKRYYGTDSTCGVSFPSTEEICKAYGLRFFRIENRNQLKKTIEKTLSVKKPVICEVICPTDQEIIPNVSSVKRKDGTLMSKPLEDMYPFLDRNEFYNEMIIKPIEEK